MTDAEFEELKRVCRIRGVAEPTEKPAALRWFTVSAEEVQKFVEERGLGGPPYGEGFEVPAGMLKDGKVDTDKLTGSYSKSYVIKDFSETDNRRTK